MRQPLDLGLVGNGQIAALITATGRIVWWCCPRFDANPVFSRLLSGAEEKGFCDVVLADTAETSTRYVRNTAILETEMRASDGSAIRITDFAPRFRRFERFFHPPQLIRRIEPLSGRPRVTIRTRPTFSYGRPPDTVTFGSHHVRYCGGGDTMRLSTDGPISHLLGESSFALTRPLTLVFGPDEPVDGSLDRISREFLERTREHWVEWVRGIGVPFDWQAEIIRAAITLKLCNYDDTGAVVAAHTTSIPEAPSSGRNWDYRYCWLRDVFFVIRALNRLGATQTMEGYLNYIASLALDTDGPLRPVYEIVHGEPLPEWIATDLSGFQEMGPVRVGNQASEQMQHDAYGSIILAASHMFLDERLPQRGDADLFRSLEPLAEAARRLATEPDAGIWEYRGRSRVHTHSAAMCWVACDRMSRVAWRLGIHDRAQHWQQTAGELRSLILSQAWNEFRGALVGAFGHADLDASVLLLPELGLLPASDERFVRTCKLIGEEHSRHGYIMRYTTTDDFGAPQTSFLACQFWYCDALNAIGRTDEAREIYTDLLQRRTSLGMLSEDIHPQTRQLWGNLPQSYSMAGLINTGMSLSRSWDLAWSGD